MPKTQRQFRDDYLACLHFPLTPANPRDNQTGADDHDDRPLRLALDALNRLRDQQNSACNEIYHGGARAVLSTYRWSQLQDSILNTIATIVPILDRLDDLADKTLD
jgi:hypothetical protein